MRRRDFLTWMGMGLAGTTGAASRCQTRNGGETAGLPGRDGASAFTPDVELALTAAPSAIQILPGAPTQVWAYSGSVIKGPPNTVQSLPGSYLGPIIRLHTGQKVRIHFANQLPERTIVHWHGLHVPERMDGHPRFIIPNGQSYTYEFEVINRAGTYWYHPHHHDRTGPQVYNGLAGLLLVSDPTEAALGLPSGAQEIVCVLQDRTFDADNQLVYRSNGPLGSMSGFLGDRVLVNGQAQSSLSLGTRGYRFRLLNGSNSRVYKLAWGDGTPMTVIGTDGGLLEQSLRRPYLTLAPGERADVILDLSRHPVGTSLQLRSLAFPSAPFEIGMGMGMGMGRGMRPGGMGRMGGTGRQASPANGTPFAILTIRVQRRESSNLELPATLSTFDASWHPGQTDRSVRRLTVQFGRMQWLLNGSTFEMDAVAPNETVSLDAKEVWEFDNSGPAMMGMRLAHPLHLHGRQFRVLNRQVDPRLAKDGDSLREGFTDEGWKDTVLVMPGERVQILVHFTRYPGMFLYHCHNLEHEDMGMMRNYRVVSRAG
jgi:FtsP/CotA-like multicopper oxidase with cupredoxin domain